MCLAVPGKIENIDDSEPMFRTGKVCFGGILKTVSLACVPQARTGDYVLVHAGLAISLIDEEEARKTLDCLEKIGGMETPEMPLLEPNEIH
uniref:[NiFe] hydrogenase metallocenter assembly protein HypC n=1 Tax=uncultured bacterium contig00009 TaxID=1181501 RepID=A0A806KID2_9BACT|nr:[NiFe] hydrogenase metallocenter assembly protein HypC [uncultured bacterium contig00009]